MFAALLAAAAAVCPLTEARYALRADRDVTAEFRQAPIDGSWPGGVAFRVAFARSGHVYWFLPWSGGASGVDHLASTTAVDAPGWRPPDPDDGPRPLGDLTYIAADGGYAIQPGSPKRGGAAPLHILLPELGDRTWRAGRDAAPMQFFDLVRCGSRP
jgi:hypothetical protein